MAAKDWRGEVGFGTGFARSLAELYQADGLEQLRARLSDSLADLGFWGVGDCASARQIGPQYFDIAQLNWDNYAGQVGDRRDDLVTGLFEAGAAVGHEEENRRLRWRAAQKRPYLTVSGAPARFQAHQAFLNLYRDFGLSAAGTLVIPMPDERAGPRRIWAVAERKADLQNAAAVTQFIAVYYLMGRLWLADDTHGQKGRIDAPDLTPETDRPVVLTESQREVLRWAAAGKTLEDIATITGISYRTVRFHMDKARNSYGFATMQQTIVRAALDYGLDPLGGESRTK